MQNIKQVPKARKPKEINFIDKKTFRLTQRELDNLAMGARVFDELQSDYIRRLLQLDPKKLKLLINAIETLEHPPDYEELKDPGFCELLEGTQDIE